MRITVHRCITLKADLSCIQHFSNKFFAELHKNIKKLVIKYHKELDHKSNLSIIRESER